MLNLVTAILKTRTNVFQINETHNSFHFTCNALDLGRNFYWKILRPLRISMMPVKERLGDYPLHSRGWLFHSLFAQSQGCGSRILFNCRSCMCALLHWWFSCVVCGSVYGNLCRTSSCADCLTRVVYKS